MSGIARTAEAAQQREAEQEEREKAAQEATEQKQKQEQSNPSTAMPGSTSNPSEQELIYRHKR